MMGRLCAGQRRGRQQRARGGSALRWRLANRGVLPSPLISSPSGQRRGKAAMRWRRLSTRGGRQLPLVSVAACTAARRGTRGVRPSPLVPVAAWAAARRSAAVTFRTGPRVDQWTPPCGGRRPCQPPRRRQGLFDPGPLLPQIALSGERWGPSSRRLPSVGKGDPVRRSLRAIRLPP